MLSVFLAIGETYDELLNNESFITIAHQLYFPIHVFDYSVFPET